MLRPYYLHVAVAVAAVGLAGAVLPAYADPQSECQSGSGTYMTGVVTAPPKFWSGHRQRGVELSHTHVALTSDQDGKSYDVAIDNVFASGYDQAGESVPAPLSTIQLSSHLALCGKLYTDHTGIDWVHTNCGQTPTSDKPNGSLRIIAADGTRGDNLESATEYCQIFR